MPQVPTTAPQQSWENAGVWFLCSPDPLGAGKLGAIIPMCNFLFDSGHGKLGPLYILAGEEII